MFYLKEILNFYALFENNGNKKRKERKKKRQTEKE